MFLLKSKYPEYYSYQGRKISKKISISKKNLVNKFYNQISLDREIIRNHESANISKKISDKIPKGFKKISESGISDINVIKDLKNYGYSGFLIGEKFMMNHKKESISHFIKNINNET